MKKILFLRVGIDRGCGGRLSPMLEDRKFEYVPIPEISAVRDGIKYSDIPARGGGSLAQVIGRDDFAHHDPEFKTFSYGEPSHPKRSQLARLNHGDYLVFYAGFQGDDIETGTCCVIGYLFVDSVHSMTPDLPWPPAKLSHLNNAHFRRTKREDSLVVVEGNHKHSRLLTHAEPISDASQQILPSISAIIGLTGSVKRAVGRWVPNTHIKTAHAWLDALN